MATTLRRMIKKVSASSLAIPLGNRTTRTSTTINTSYLFRSNSIPTHHHFSSLAERRSKADDTLLRLIEAEIEKKSPKVAEVPRECPFNKIVDNPGERFYVVLSREYQGEEIEIEVYKEGWYPYRFQLHVSVSKKGGPTLVLKGALEPEDHLAWNKFHVTYPNATNDYVLTIDNLDVKNPIATNFINRYEVPPFWDWNRDLQEAFYEYLEVRGIEPSIVEVLYDSLDEKKRKKYPAWFKKMKSFIANECLETDCASA